MTDSFDDFALELDRIAPKIADEAIVDAHRRYHMAGLRGVVLRTPVDTGNTRGQWQSTLATPAQDEVATRSAQAVLDEGERVVDAVPPFSQSFISNPSKAAEVLELGLFEPKDPGPSDDPRPGRKGRVLVKGGFSVQAPQGMVAVTVAELEATPLEQLE